MRILLVSDTHGFIDPRILRLAEGCVLAVHAGDIVGANVIQELQAVTSNVISVRGNNDVPGKWPAAERGLLHAIPEEQLIDLPGGSLAVVHGHRVWNCRDRHRRLRALYPQARAVVYGHSHRPVHDQDTTPWVINPGAAGKNRTFGGPACMILHATSHDWRVEQHRFAPLLPIKTTALAG
jgi:putative phosphoesterase